MLIRITSCTVCFRGGGWNFFAGVPAGTLLLAYADAANRDPSGSLALHDEMLDVLGPEGLVEAASTDGSFL